MRLVLYRELETSFLVEIWGGESNEAPQRHPVFDMICVPGAGGNSGVVVEVCVQPSCGW